MTTLIQTLPGNGLLFLARFLARIIDLLLMAFLAVLIAMLFSALHVNTRHGTGQVGYDLLLLLEVWLYFALMESSPLQATLGKRAMRLIVTEAHGETLTFGRATGRHFAKALSDLLFGLGYLVALFTPHARALHDYVAGTSVEFEP